MRHLTTYPAPDQRGDRMELPDCAALRERLRARQAALGATWYRAIVARAAVGRISATCDSLTELVGQISEALLAEPFVREPARAIGRTLPRVLGAQPRVLGTTLEFLAGELVAGLQAHQAAALQPRLAALLGEVSVGFLVQAQGTRVVQSQGRPPAPWAGAATPTPPRSALTPRDSHVLRELVAGKSNREIAILLGVGEKAIEKAMSALFAKLGVTTRVQAAVRAVREGLLEDTAPDR